MKNMPSQCLPLWLALAACVCASATVHAQDPAAPAAPPAMSGEEQAMMQAFQQAGTPGAPHAAMAKAAGEYDLAIRSWHSPDAPPTEETGIAKRSMALGGRVMVEEVTSTMMGQPFTGHGMHGYDNVSGKYWATWNDSMSTGVMVSEGSCDDAGNCNFTGTWNDPIRKAAVQSRMTTRWTSPDVEVFEMYGPGQDGKEAKMMEITYTRRR